MDGLALDSLELMAASDAVSRFFRLHETAAENDLLVEPTLAGWARTVAASLAAGVDGVTFATSGTTGTPKLCPQKLEVLYEEAQHWRRRLQGRQRVVQTFAAHHIYGFLFTILLPEVTGWPVLDIRMMHPGSLRSALRPTDLLVGFPTGLAALLQHSTDLPDGISIVSATSSLSAATHDGLRSRGAAEVVDIYGSSETAGIASRRSPTMPFELLPRWGRSAAETAVVEISTGATFTLPDRVTWEGERLLRPAERIDGAVQVSGINVFPEQVASKLKDHPMVLDCEVSLDTGSPEPRLRAVLVPVSGMDADAVIAACDHWARRNLSAPERPVSFTIATKLATPNL